ncbi:MADS-domain transcription factor [Heracleum sosnowskyi]|uniref:MADS-domain transcription factor n=1 Tax=Heracleum sosnowskyi TaxID=360622 RepID=A0AAD8M2V4_9APIA|nr:MADS-domain transcription factor [Heracleum sosnowskyi]
MGRGKIEIKKIENRTNSTGKLHEYTSPNTSTKKIYDQYQKTQGCDLWVTHYENMQETLRKMKEINKRLRNEIGIRVGTGDLSNMKENELYRIEQKMEDSVSIIRERKYHVIKTQTDTCKKKVDLLWCVQVRNLEELHGNLLLDFDAICLIDPRYAAMKDDGGAYEVDPVVSYGNGMYNHRFYANFHQGDGVSGGPDLRLA